MPSEIKLSFYFSIENIEKNVRYKLKNLIDGNFKLADWSVSGIWNRQLWQLTADSWQLTADCRFRWQLEMKQLQLASNVSHYLELFIRNFKWFVSIIFWPQQHWTEFSRRRLFFNLLMELNGFSYLNWVQLDSCSYK